MKKDLIPSLILAGGMIGIALAASLARQQGWLDSEAVNRIVMGTIGLMLVWVGNRMPKTFVPAAAAREVNRIGGWSMVLSGLVYAGLWAFAPTDVAVIGGCAAVIVGIAVTVGTCLSLRAKAPAA
ncbi:MAG: ammonium transporter [Brevundimonas sp.]|nr:ammonium transporter [Brevundimonas sp.]